MTHPARQPRLGLPDLGVGVGLRVPHYDTIHASRERLVDWFEIISENFFVQGGLPLEHLRRILAKGYPVVQHGVSLSVGGVEPLDGRHIEQLRALRALTGSPWVSDHLCFCGAGGAHLHDLLPLPYTPDVARHVAQRACEVQDRLGVRFVLENVSSYMTYAASTMTEWDFVAAVAEEADVGLLLDVNNIYVSSYNHRFDPARYIEAIPRDRVVQIHIAGHTNLGRYILDTHSGDTIDEVWALYRLACERFGAVSTLIEWDSEIPAFDVLLGEVRRAKEIRREVLGAQPEELQREARA